MFDYAAGNEIFEAINRRDFYTARQGVAAALSMALGNPGEMKETKGIADMLLKTIKELEQDTPTNAEDDPEKRERAYQMAMQAIEC